MKKLGLITMIITWACWNFWQSLTYLWRSISRLILTRKKGHTSYLSKTIWEEFISLVRSSVHGSIICELKNTKCYTIFLDFTPAISNDDQLSLIARYVLPTGTVERFIIFLDMDSHNADHLQDKLLTFLNESSMDIGNCQGQSCDNASNMNCN